MGYYSNQEVESQADFDLWTYGRRPLLPTRSDSLPTRRSRRETYRKPKATYTFSEMELAVFFSVFGISVAGNITWALLEAMGS